MRNIKIIFIVAIMLFATTVSFGELTIKDGKNIFTGNVGIGTTSPNYPLHIYQASTYSGLKLENPGNIWMIQSDTGFGGGAGLSFYSGTAKSYRMVINGAGYVGIGTTSPNYPLHIYQASTYSGLKLENPGNIWMLQSDTGFGGGAGLSFYSETAKSYRMVINGAGNVGIGTTNSQYALDIPNGQVRAINVSVTSDERLKTNVQTLQNSLDKVSQLRGVFYEWKDETKGKGRQIGVIAQEVEKEYPELVFTDSEGYKSVAYDKLAAVLIESTKELKVQNEALLKRIEALEKLLVK